MAKKNSKAPSQEFVIKTLGPAKIDNPEIRLNGKAGISHLVEDGTMVRVDPFWPCGEGEPGEPEAFELAGPRPKIYFDPTKLKVAVATCGGMCPGINTLVRAMVLQLHYIYGVRNVFGIRYGLQGFIPKYGHEIVELTPEMVRFIHGRGGSFLGMSRGPQPMDEVVDALERLNIGLLFMIGGDGTMRAAQSIHLEVEKRGLKCGVIGLPKTIDNDVHYCSRTFGFQTAVERATHAILGAHNEALGVPYGVGLVKLMGRHSGFVAAHATLALSEVNFCLIPEVDFELDGRYGLLARLEERLSTRGHAVVVAAEGAGQKFFDDGEMGRDASGNKKLGNIGEFLKERISGFCMDANVPMTLKYIDPSYLIRSVPANANDRIFSGFLGHNAVHAGMAGKTDMLVSHWNNQFVHVPIGLATSKRRTVDPRGGLWQAVLESTGQQALFANDQIM